MNDNEIKQELNQETATVLAGYLKVAIERPLWQRALRAFDGDFAALLDAFEWQDEGWDVVGDFTVGVNDDILIDCVDDLRLALPAEIVFAKPGDTFTFTRSL